MDRGAWKAIVHRIAKSWTQLSDCACAHKVFIKRKKSIVCLDRHMGRLREREWLSRTLVAVSVTFMGHFFRVSLGQ